jgi:hypothetical protein
MSIAIAGHGATLQMELDPEGAAGVFTEIAELNGDLTGLGLRRPMSDVTPHQDDIDSYVSGVLQREQWRFTVNYVHANTTHDGLRGHILDKTRFGIRFLGPTPTAGAGVDEIIASGELAGWNETNPVREGARTAEVMFQASKAMKIDGVIYGTAA